MAIDTRERYGLKFARRSVAIVHRALPAGDYAAVSDEAVVAVVERKTLENLATSLSDGGLAFQRQRLAEMPEAAIVVEGDYPDVFRTQPGRHAGPASSDLPRCRSCSLALARSLRSGPIAFWQRRSVIAANRPSRPVLLVPIAVLCLPPQSGLSPPRHAAT